MQVKAFSLFIGLMNYIERYLLCRFVRIIGNIHLFQNFLVFRAYFIKDYLIIIKDNVIGHRVVLNL